MSVLQIDYYKNGQFKGASGASIFQSSNSQSAIAFKFEDDIEDAIVFANILLPYPENSQLYGQYKAQSLIMEKKVDTNGGYIYIGQLLAQYLQTNGKAYVNAQIQASEGLYKFQNDTTQTQYITLAGVVYEISTNTVTIDGHSVDLLVLTNNLTGEVYNQVNAGVITVKNVIYKITEFANNVLKMESGFAVDNYQRVEFKITASAPYYSAMPMTPEESIIFADAIAKNQYDIVNLQQDKQDKDDPLINPDANPGDDNDHTVVGNINTLLGDTAQNTDDIGTLQNEMSQAQQDIHDLQVLIEYGVNIVGEMTTTDALPTDAQVSAFVTAQTGEAPVRGEAVIVRVDYTAGTDTIYLYVFDGADWKHFEMQFLNDAGNGIKGLIAGNYNAGDLSTPDKFMVNISNGQILDIVRVDPNGNYVTLKDSLDLVIEKLLDTSTGYVQRAKNDQNGREIDTTYMTKQEGATKVYVQQYASPKALYDLNYPDYALGQYKSINASDSSYRKTTTAIGAGYTALATITKVLDADILLGDQNGLINRIWISANHTEDIKLHIETSYIDANSVEHSLAVEETETMGVVAGIIALKQVQSVFAGLTTPITLPAGTTLKQVIEVFRNDGGSYDFTLYCDTTNDAYMTLDKIGYVRYSLEQEPSAIETGHDSAPTIDSDGDLLVQSTDGAMHYANGDSQELTTILKVPMASGINASEVRPPKAGDVKTALDGKLTKQDGTSTYPQAYTKGVDGTQAMMDITDSTVNNAIVRRNGQQVLVPQTPTANSHATSKKYVDDGLSGKLNKVETIGYDQVYAKDSNGTQVMVPYAVGAEADFIVRRAGNGDVIVPTPTHTNGATPKVYVDTTDEKLLYNLGAFDTITARDSKSVTISRKTGYVDLGALEWTKFTSGNISAYYAVLGNDVVGSVKKCALYTYNTTATSIDYLANNEFYTSTTDRTYFRNDTYSTADDFKTAMSGVLLEYELTTATTEQVIINTPLTPIQLAPTLKNKGVFNQLVPNNYISYTNNATGWFNFNSNANISNGDMLYITLEASNVNNPIILGNSPTNNSQTIVEKSDIIINTKIHKIATATGNYNFVNTYFEVNNVQLKYFNIVDLTSLFGAGAEPTLAECQKLFKQDYYEYTTSGKILVADNDNNGFVVEIGKEVATKEEVDDKTSLSAIRDLLYPVGSVYTTKDSTANPNTLFGGTWVALNGGNKIYLPNASKNNVYAGGRHSVKAGYNLTFKKSDGNNANDGQLIISGNGLWNQTASLVPGQTVVPDNLYTEYENAIEVYMWERTV